MLNSLLSPARPDDPELRDWSGYGWRLRGVGILFTAAAAIVLMRLSWVQTQLPGEYVAALTATTVEEEWIPARDGRILIGSDVLVSDAEVHSLQVHYRWLQSEPDPYWLRQQVRDRLSREEWRDAGLVAKVERQILAERDALRNSLSDVTGLSLDELLKRMQMIENRVRRIHQDVNQRHQSGTKTVDDDEAQDSTGFLIQWLSAARDSLTTPPKRDDQRDIVVREEEAWHTVVEDVSSDVTGMITEFPRRFPGVRIGTSMKRSWGTSDLAVHVVGARTQATDEELNAKSGPAASSTIIRSAAEDRIRIGRFGVEHSYDALLSGVPGIQRTIRDRRQRVVSSEIVRRPVSGRDLTLTLDRSLQEAAEQLLAESLGDAERLLLLSPSEDPAQDEERSGPPEPEFIPTGGCVVVMEAATGRLLASASAPEFDLAMFTDGSPAQWAAVNSDTRRPFVPRFTGMALPPGSTYKILTAVAGLETGAISRDSVFACQGFLSRPDEHRCLVYRLHGVGHGPVTLKSALAQSCNVYFFEAAGRMGLLPLLEWSERLEFGRTTGVDLPFEKSGSLPSSASAVRAGGPESARRMERETLGLAIGQSRLTVTPLQMARMLAVVANGGWLVTPHVVSDDGAARQSTEALVPYQATRHRVPGLHESTLAAVRDGLRSAVEDPIGTGFRTMRVDGVPIAGKTGTAENVPGKPDHAWFAGYVPADHPKYVVVVALEHGGSGSRAAGPIVRELVRTMQRLGWFAGLIDTPSTTLTPGENSPVTSGLSQVSLRD